MARSGDDAMPRSEERRHVGTGRQENSRSRPREYVITEEAEHEVTLHAPNAPSSSPGPGPRPFRSERVRQGAGEHVEGETVRGRVRKEHVETDLPDRDTDR
ncbi:hypothetical protein ACWDZ4_29200 [Streptomyces sp. NPDC003016]